MCWGGGGGGGGNSSIPQKCVQEFFYRKTVIRFWPGRCAPKAQMHLTGKE